jgi:hypothetical protein
MKVIPLEKTALTLPEAAELAKGDTIILTRGGQPLAAIQDLSGSDWESVSLANNPRFRALIEESRRSYREEGGITLESLRSELGLKTPRRASKKRKADKGSA